jgi:hypothetical protein
MPSHTVRIGFGMYQGVLLHNIKYTHLSELSGMAGSILRSKIIRND